MYFLYLTEYYLYTDTDIYIYTYIHTHAYIHAPTHKSPNSTFTCVQHLSTPLPWPSKTPHGGPRKSWFRRAFVTYVAGEPSSPFVQMATELIKSVAWLQQSTRYPQEFLDEAYFSKILGYIIFIYFWYF